MRTIAQRVGGWNIAHLHGTHTATKSDSIGVTAFALLGIYPLQQREIGITGPRSRLQENAARACTAVWRSGGSEEESSEAFGTRRGAPARGATAGCASTPICLSSGYPSPPGEACIWCFRSGTSTAQAQLQYLGFTSLKQTLHDMTVETPAPGPPGDVPQHVLSGSPDQQHGATHPVWFARLEDQAGCPREAAGVGTTFGGDISLSEMGAEAVPLSMQLPSGSQLIFRPAQHGRPSSACYSASSVPMSVLNAPPNHLPTLSPEDPSDQPAVPPSKPAYFTYVGGGHTEQTRRVASVTQDSDASGPTRDGANVEGQFPFPASSLPPRQSLAQSRHGSLVSTAAAFDTRPPDARGSSCETGAPTGRWLSTTVEYDPSARAAPGLANYRSLERSTSQDYGQFSHVPATWATSDANGATVSSSNETWGLPHEDPPPVRNHPRPSVAKAVPAKVQDSRWEERPANPSLAAPIRLTHRRSVAAQLAEAKQGLADTLDSIQSNGSLPLAEGRQSSPRKGSLAIAESTSLAMTSGSLPIAQSMYRQSPALTGSLPSAEGMYRQSPNPTESVPSAGDIYRKSSNPSGHLPSAEGMHRQSTATTGSFPSVAAMSRQSRGMSGPELVQGPGMVDGMSYTVERRIPRGHWDSVEVSAAVIGNNASTQAANLHVRMEGLSPYASLGPEYEQGQASNSMLPRRSGVNPTSHQTMSEYEHTSRKSDYDDRSPALMGRASITQLVSPERFDRMLVSAEHTKGRERAGAGASKSFAITPTSPTSAALRARQSAVLTSLRAVPQLPQQSQRGRLNDSAKLASQQTGAARVDPARGRSSFVDRLDHTLSLVEGDLAYLSRSFG
eukprot:jgi/Botrbrau1/9126/Bobra.160_3s0003.1